jgi:DNA polymerase (family X)
VSSRREAWQTVSVQRVLDVVGEFDDSDGASLGLDNPEIDRLDAFASLLELVEANPYTVRAYRRAAGTIRGAAIPVAELARSGRVRELRGIGPGIEARLRELVETGEIAELAALERELATLQVGATSNPPK